MDDSCDWSYRCGLRIQIDISELGDDMSAERVFAVAETLHDDCGTCGDEERDLLQRGGEFRG